MTELSSPTRYPDVEACVEDVLSHVGKRVVLGLPLGLGKPAHFVNEIYRRAVDDHTIDLTICTALSLERPRWSSDLERRFLEPFVERQFGGYVDLVYVSAMRAGTLPDNVRVKEFYTKAGSYLNLGHAQQNYISSNYTHAYRDILDAGANVIAQLVCKGEVDGELRFSLSCNPDVTLDVTKALRRMERAGKAIAAIAVVNQNLPFMYGDAVVEPGFFTGVVDDPCYYSRLFGAPKMAVTDTDFMIGLHASALIRDGGTLQIGIGSLGDALVYGLSTRQTRNATYRTVLSELGVLDRFGGTIAEVGGVEPFEEGLNGCTEMFVDGYLELLRAGVVKRRTYEDVPIQRLLNERRISERVGRGTLEALLEAGAISPELGEADVAYLRRWGVLRPECRLEAGELRCGDGRAPADLSTPAGLDAVARSCLGAELRGGILVHGGFFLGPESFYDELKAMSEEERRRIWMTSVLKVNQLYENEYATEELKTLQRLHGRFVNACLMVTLTGGVVSDGLETGQTVSGVGGQYNFVSQAHALPDGRSILMCKATRSAGREVQSNVVYSYGHITIPRHLRDIVITEYGIANLRSKSDQEIIAALLAITDSRFQDELLRRAKAEGKLPETYEIPEKHRQNFPERIAAQLKPFKKDGFFPAFPFGTDFTPEELKIGKALKTLKARMARGATRVASLGKAATTGVPAEALPYLARLGLDSPKGGKERLMRKLVVHALKESGVVSA